MSNNIITIKYYSFMHEFHRRLCATIVELKAWMSNEIPQKTIMRKYQSMPQCQLICKMVPGERLLEVSRPSHCSVNEYRTIRGLSWVTILGHNWDDLAWISLVTASLSRFFSNDFANENITGITRLSPCIQSIRCDFYEDRGPIGGIYTLLLFI